MIPDEIVAEVRERTDIVALVQEFVNLRKVGSSFKGLCPFHSEKTPSFHVHPDRGFFYCFGCQASGDAIRFLMNIEGRSFPSAVRTLAERAGIEIPSADSAEDRAREQARRRRSRLASLMEAACGYYMQELHRHPLAVAAREELERRGIQPETAEAFRLGYAPQGWDHLVKFLHEKHWSPQEAEELGLIVPRRNKSGFYDRFRHRLVFPITDHQGQIVAFSGRILPLAESDGAPVGEGAAKYVNSPEGPLYRKGNILYGLFEGRVDIRREQWALMCEGNFDLIALHQAGFRNAVAPMGTAFTERQASLLRRYCGRVVMLFDGDRAGRDAVRKAAPILAKTGVSARVVSLPSGLDPDGFIRKSGAEALQNLVAGAPGIVEHLIDDAASGASDAADKARAIEELGPVLMEVGNPVETQLYVERVAQKFGIASHNAVRQQLRRGVLVHRGKNQRNVAGGGSGNAREQAVNESKARQSSTVSLPEMECELVGAVLDQPSLLETEAAEKLHKLLTNADLRAILYRARETFFSTGAARQTDTPNASREDGVQPGGEAPLDAGAQEAVELGAHPPSHSRRALSATHLLTELLSDESFTTSGQRWIERRLAVQRYDPEGAQRVLEDGLVRLELASIKEQLPALDRRIIGAQRHGDAALAESLMREKKALLALAVKLQAKG